MEQNSYRTGFDKDYKGGNMYNESYKGIPSKTKPDQNISIRQLLNRHTRGIPTEIAEQRQPLYFGDLQPPKNLDLTDIDDYRKAIKAKDAEIQKSIQTEFETIKAERERKAAELQKENSEANSKTEE